MKITRGGKVTSKACEDTVANEKPEKSQQKTFLIVFILLIFNEKLVVVEEKKIAPLVKIATYSHTRLKYNLRA